MKVMQINDFYEGGGAEVVYRNTTKLLKIKGLEVAEFDNREISGVKGILKPISYIYSYESKNKLSEKLEKFKPQIIHIHNYYHVLSPSILKSIKEYKIKYNCKVIMTVHDFHLMCPNTGFIRYKVDNINICDKCTDKSYYRCMIKNCDRRGIIYSTLKSIRSIVNYNILKLNNIIDIYITPSEFMKNKLKSVTDISKIFVIKNPIFNVDDLNLIKYDNETKKYDLVFAGRLSKEKGIKKFLELLVDINSDISLAIVGDGEQREEISRFIEKNKLSNVDMLGIKSHKETLNIIKNSSALVLPSCWYENAPLSLIESYILKKPFFINPIGGMLEFASNTLKDTSKSFINKENLQNFENVLKNYKFKEDNTIVEEYNPEFYINKVINLYNI